MEEDDGEDGGEDGGEENGDVKVGLSPFPPFPFGVLFSSPPSPLEYFISLFRIGALTLKPCVSLFIENFHHLCHIKE